LGEVPKAEGVEDSLLQKQIVPPEVIRDGHIEGALVVFLLGGHSLVDEAIGNVYKNITSQIQGG
jgi:hypothetical protein